jgi:signal transduction histidine kinase
MFIRLVRKSMTVSPGLHSTTSIHTHLTTRWVWIVLSVLLVIFYIVSVVLSVPELLHYPERLLSDQWTQAQVEKVLAPLGVPSSWLVWLRLFLEIGFATTAILVAALIFILKPKERFSEVVAFWLVMHGTFSGVFAESVALLHPSLAPLTRGLLLAGWMGLFILAYVFPTGKFVPRASVAVIPFFILVFVLFIPTYVLGQGEPSSILSGLLLALGFGGVLAQGFRYFRSATPIERQQARWIWFAVASRVVYVIVISLPPVRSLVTAFSWQGLLAQVVMGIVSFAIAAILPIAIGVTILRYRLWDIDPILNRALVYGGLTLFIIGSYGLVVGGIGSFLGAKGVSPLLSILTTGVVAVTFQPLRERLQRAANRLIYGQRDEPYQVLTRLGQRLETAVDPAYILTQTVETIAQALKLPYVAITQNQEHPLRTVAAYGTPQNYFAQFPLIFASETIGTLVAAPRAPDETLSQTDQRLLSDLARQISLAVHAAQLAANLQQARLRIVEAGEETRRRLGNDLHDGVGHALTGLARRTELAAQMLKSDPQEVQKALNEITLQLNLTISQVRALAHQLHPPELEVLGLVEALREQAQTHPGLTVRLESQETLPKLPVTVETAAYYIALEALTNVEKHAGAHSCTIQLSLSKRESPGQPPLLTMQITDDGKGLAVERIDGLGLLSMQGRAVEVGGTCQIRSNPAGGTCITVSLPVHFSEEGV